MAERTWLVEHKSGGIIIATVEGLLIGDTSNALEVLNYPDRTFHVLGTLPGGGNYTIQGANEDITAEYQTLHLLHDPSKEDFDTRTSKVLAGIVENPRFVKVTAVNGATTNLKVIVTLYTSR